jgi:UDP-N-acetylglucosamine 2-epimerase (non-hydrolysing)
LAPVVHALKDDERFDARVCVTAQHREMLDQVLGFFEIKPDFDLDLMRPDQALDDLTASVLKCVGPVLNELQPDVVLVQGDTTSSFAAALAAYYRQMPVGHVEAGLRTGDRYSPFPEEINRALTGRLTDYHLAPTEGARRNLLNEGVDEGSVFVTGNTVVDALLSARDKVKDWRPDHNRGAAGDGLEPALRADHGAPPRKLR